MVTTGRMDASKINVEGDLTMVGDRVMLYNGSKVDGDLTMTDVVNSHATNSNAYSNGVWLLDSTVTGKMNLTTPDNIEIRNSKQVAQTANGVDVYGTATLKSTGGQIALENVELGATTIESKLMTRIAGTDGNVFHGDLKINKANSLSIGNVDIDSHDVEFGSLTVDGDLIGTIDSTICVSDVVKADNITLISDKSSILTSYQSNGQNGSLTTTDTTGKITLTAEKGEITSVCADKNITAPKVANFQTGELAQDEQGNTVYVPSSYYYELMSTQDHITMDNLVGAQKTGVEITGGSAEVKAMGAVGLNADLAGDLTAESGRNIVIKGEVDGHVKATSKSYTLENGTQSSPRVVELNGATIGNGAELEGGRINVYNSNITGDVTANDVYNNHTTSATAYSQGVWLKNSSINGDFTATTPDNVNVRNSSVVGNTKLTSTDGEVNVEDVTMTGDTTIDAALVATVSNYVGDINVFDGDLNIKGNSIHFGYFDNANGHVITPGEVVVTGTLNAKAPSTIGYSIDVTADKTIIESTNSSFVQAITDDFVPTLITNELTVKTAAGGAVVGLDANKDSVFASNGDIAADTYYYAMSRDYVPGARSASEFGSLNVKAKSGDTVALNLDSGITNVKVDADKTVAKGNVNDLSLTGTGAVEVTDLKAVKVAGDNNNKSGSVVVATTKPDTDIKIGNVEADTDIIVNNEAGTITQTGVLTADKEVNTVGDVILNAKRLNDIGGNNPIKGANVTLTQTEVPAGNTIALSNITAYAAGTDEAGDITISMPAENVDLSNITATHDITILKNPTDDRNAVIFDTIKLNNVIADSEENGRGDLNLKAKNDILAENVGGANINLTSTNGDITVVGAKSARHADDTTAAAQASNATAGNKSGNIVVTAENGNILLNNINAATDIIGSAENGAIYVTGNLVADANDLTTNSALNNVDNGIGDVILSGKYFVGDNFSTPDSTVAIKGAGVALTQTDAQDNLVMSNITADATGNDNSGDVVINIPVKNVDLNNIHATKDIAVNNGTADGVLDSATLTNVIADSEENGIGDLKIKTTGAINANRIGGANIELESTNGSVTVNDARSARGNQPDDKAGNVSIIAKADDAVITIGNISADTDVLADASNGSINQTGNIIADAVDKNGVGTVTLKAKDGLNVGGDKGVIAGGDIVLEVGTGDIIASNLTADGQGDDAHGNITIYTPNGNVTIGTEDKPVKGTGDVTITTDNGKADVVNTEADSEKNGIGTLTINATDDVTASNVGGGNVVIESKDGDVTAEDVTAHAPNDNDNGDVIITANNGDVTVDGVNGDHDVIITAGGDANVTDAHADTDNNKAGDLIVNAGGKADVEDGSGNNVDIEADGDITAKDINGKDDVTIISDNGKVDGENLIADGDDDGIGDLVIKGKDDVNVDGGEGSNVIIQSDDGDVNAKDITADGDDSNGDGNVIIDAHNGDVTGEDIVANKDIVITVDGGSVDLTSPITPDYDNNGVGELIINGVRNGGLIIDDEVSSEVTRILNTLYQTGVDTTITQSFTPIAFAAGDDEDENYIAKRIAKTVFKTPETGIVTITEQYKTMR